MTTVRPEKMVDSSKFLQEVEQFSKTTGSDYMDSLIHVAQDRGMEIETVASMVKTSSKAKAFLQESAERLNYLPKTARLPV